MKSQNWQERNLGSQGKVQKFVLVKIFAAGIIRGRKNDAAHHQDGYNKIC